MSTAPLPLHFDDAAAFLSALDDDWAALITQIGMRPPLTPATSEPYQALINAIAHQQIHGKAAAAILGRFKALYPGQDFPSAAAITETDDTLLRGCGFSASKLNSIRGIAEHTLTGLVPTLAESLTMTNEALIERLTQLKGIGQWTVEMFLMHHLGRPDILPVDDFGVREGWKRLKGLETQPKPKDLAEIGKVWSPYRSTAAWYLWRRVDQINDKDGM